MFWIAANLQKHSGSGLSHPWLLDDSTTSCLILVFVWVFFFSFVMLEIRELASIPHPSCMRSLQYPQDRVNSIIGPLFLWSPNHTSQSSLPYRLLTWLVLLHLHRFPMPWASVRTSNGDALNLYWRHSMGQGSCSQIILLAAMQQLLNAFVLGYVASGTRVVGFIRFGLWFASRLVSPLLLGLEGRHSSCLKVLFHHSEDSYGQLRPGLLNLW